MSSNTFVDKRGNTLRIPASLGVKSGRFQPVSRHVSPPNLRIFSCPDSDISGNLYAHAIRHQQMNESVELLAFAALAGSGIAGILSAFI
jgi:hypothetical protein